VLQDFESTQKFNREQIKTFNSPKNFADQIALSAAAQKKMAIAKIVNSGNR